MQRNYQSASILVHPNLLKGFLPSQDTLHPGLTLNDFDVYSADTKMSRRGQLVAIDLQKINYIATMPSTALTKRSMAHHICLLHKPPENLFWFRMRATSFNSAFTWEDIIQNSTDWWWPIYSFKPQYYGCAFESETDASLFQHKYATVRPAPKGKTR